MNSYTDFYVDKTSRTFADSLVAFGLARVLADLLNRQTGSAPRIRLHDAGPYYRITCKPALERAAVREHGPTLEPIRAIKTAKNAASLPAGIPAWDYEQERERVNLYFAARKQAGKADLGPDGPPKPHVHWDIFRAINPGALVGYNGLVANWWAVRRQPEALLILLDLYAVTPNDFAAAEGAWKQLAKDNGWDIKPTVTCQQVYNPDQGKGQNKGKADGLSIGNLDGFWLSEWLKAIGFYEAALTRQVRGAKDRKTFVVAPRNLALADNQKVMEKFVGKMQFAETSTRFDILAAIRYTVALLEHIREEPSLASQISGRRSIRQNVVAGFHTAFYKDLGNATATMNVSFIALPGWVKVETSEDIRLYVNPKANHEDPQQREYGLLDELELLVRQFDESHSDAFTLLQYLRDFVSGDNLDAFFRFTNAFPAYLMGQREQGKYAFSLSTEFIERLVMSTEEKLTPILQSEGFQNIAYAIRQSTVTAQYRKKQGDRKYDVRYGLGQELARKSRYPKDFVAALSDFLHKYNAENAQVMETRPAPYRRNVKTTDIDEIVRLIDGFGSETVANLLIAYGYARVSREEEPDMQPDIESKQEENE
jgi:hypothetical protein